MSTWNEQWDRANRWRVRIEEYRRPRPLEQGLDAARVRDEMIAFLQAAYHVGDWIANDVTVAPSRAQVDSAIDGSVPLQLCADLCNGTKHLVLASAGRSKGKFPRLAVGKLEVNVTGDEREGLSVAAQSVGLSDGQLIDFFGLADDILTAWRSALRDWGLS